VTTEITSPTEEHLRLDLSAIRQEVRLLKKDANFSTMTKREARFLVDLYYQLQDERKAMANRINAAVTVGEPNSVIRWNFDMMNEQENSIRSFLKAFSEQEASGMGLWAMGITGIGPVISAGLLAHIDISKANTAGKIWRYAGLDPTVEWNKGEKRPWNASLKVIAWKAGQSFMKVQSNPNDYYGKLYKTRKEYEIGRNDRMELADQAEAKLAKYKIGKDTDAYKSYSIGKLPPAHIDARARRWVVKIFFSHYFEQAYRRHYLEEPPLPFALAHLNHVDYIPPAPNPLNVKIVNGQLVYDGETE
jgi:hypothetical protein